MNKQELLKKVAADAKVTQKEAAAMLDSTLDAIVAAVAAGDKVQLVGFGTFEGKARKARMGRNPKTKEPMEIAATTVPAFSAGKAFKDAVSR